MLIDPPVDKLKEELNVCGYELACAVAKRARELVTSDYNYLEESKEKPITRACKDLREGKIVIERN